MTLQEVKEHIAFSYHFGSWDELMNEAHINEEFRRMCKTDPHDLLEQVAKTYAEEKVKEQRGLNGQPLKYAERATTKILKHYGRVQE